jgi:hypothetical protein
MLYNLKIQSSGAPMPRQPNPTDVRMSGHPDILVRKYVQWSLQLNSFATFGAEIRSYSGMSPMSGRA